MNIAESLQRKIGPLPAWAWGLVVGGGIVAWRLFSGGGEDIEPQEPPETPEIPDLEDITGPPGPAGPAGAPGPAGPKGDTGAAGVSLPGKDDSRLTAKEIRDALCPKGYSPKWKTDGRTRRLVCVKDPVSSKTSAISNQSFAPNGSLPAVTNQNVSTVSMAPPSTYSPTPTPQLLTPLPQITPIDLIDEIGAGEEFLEIPYVPKVPPSYPERVDGRPNFIQPTPDRISQIAAMDREDRGLREQATLIAARRGISFARALEIARSQKERGLIGQR